MGLRAGACRNGEAAADLDPFHGVDAHDGLSQEAVQLAVPLDVRAQPDGDAGSRHLEYTAQGVAGLAGGIDSPHHALGGLGVGAADGRRLHGVPVGLAVGAGGGDNR